MEQQKASKAVCEMVGSTVRDVWSTTPEVRQSVVLWEQLDGNKMRLTTSNVASVNLVLSWPRLSEPTVATSQPALAVDGGGSENGQSPQWMDSSLSSLLGYYVPDYPA